MARLSLQVSAGLGGTAKFQDFIRFHDKQAPKEITSPEAFAALFMAKKQKEAT